MAVVSAFLFSGCASTTTLTKQYKGLEQKLAVCDYKSAAAQIEKSKGVQYKKKDAVLYYLDLGMLQYMAGEAKESNQSLENAERGIEAAFTKSVSQAAASLLLNDNALDYAGEDYEDVYLNVFKSLNYLRQNAFDDAFVELRRMGEKLNVLEDKYGKMADGMNKSVEAKRTFKAGSSRFHGSALGRFMSMLAYRTDGKMDDARIDAEKIAEVWNLQPFMYNFPMPDMRACLTPTESPRLDIVCFTGLGPRKGAETFYIHTEKDVILVGRSSIQPNSRTRRSFDIFPWKGVEPDLHFKFQVPVMYIQTSMVARVEVVIDGAKHGLQPFENIQAAAIEAFKIKRPLNNFKALTRTLVKGLAAHEAKKKIRKDTKDKGDAELACMLIDISMDATENADLRISHCFPGLASIGEVMVSKGRHTIEFRYYGRDGKLLYTDKKGEVEVSDSGLNLVQSAYLN